MMMRHRMTLFGQKARECGQRAVVQVPVQPGQQDRIGRGMGDHLRRGHNLGIAGHDVAQQKTRPVARQAGVPGGDAQRIGRRRARQQQGQGKGP